MPAGRDWAASVASRPPRPFPCALSGYREEQGLTRGKVLVAEHFVALDPLEPELVLAAPVNELDALAERFGCAAVRSVVHGSAPDVSGSWPPPAISRRHHYSCGSR